MTSVTCRGCGHVTEFPGAVGRRDVCERCGLDLHCCAQCRLYDASASSGCREPQADAPRDKERSNFCEFLSLGKVVPRGMSEEDKAKAAFDALFGKKT